MSDLDRLREIHRHARGTARPVSLLDRARGVKAKVVASIEATRRYGDRARDAAGVPLWKQFVRQLRVTSKHGFSNDEFYKFRLYEDRNVARAGYFFRGGFGAEVRELVTEALSADSSGLDDKLKFYVACRENGVSTADVVSSFSSGNVVWYHGEGRLPERDLFAKPTRGEGGQGIELWAYHDGTYQSEGGDAFTAEALVAHLAERSASADYLLQPRLRNHPDLARISSGGLSTVRVVTAMESPDGEPQVLVTALRMALSSSTVDNFGEGGLAAPVDPETGILGLAIKKNLADAALDFAVHPATGHLIEGTLVPLWDEVVALARQAHRSFPHLLVVGWDIAVTTEGVVVVEGNSKPGSNLSQQPGARPLGLTPLPGIYLRALGRRAEAVRSV